MQCTIDALASTPYRDLKVTDIARAAGTSPATFYQYFVDIPAVLVAVAEQTVEDGRRLADLVTGRPWKGAAGVQSAEDLVDGVIAFWRDHRATLRVVEALSTEGDRRFRHLRVVMLNALTRALAAEIEQLQGDAAAAGVDPMAMAGALVGMLVNLAGHRAGFEAWDIRFDEVRESMARLVYWGVNGPRLPRRRTRQASA